MCVALPGKVIELNGRDAVVDFSGNQVIARAGLVDVNVGDFVLVHAGCVIQKVTKEQMEEMTAEREKLEEERKQTAEMMKELQALKEQLAAKDGQQSE